jgi:hypothetical protein
LTSQLLYRKDFYSVDGLNKQFMDDPLAFMTKFPMRTNGALDKPTPVSPGKGLAQGKANFDLDYDKEDNSIVVISLFDRPEGVKSHPIPAWWLPWKSAGTVTMKLGKDANFFFTSSLGGCRIQYSGGAEPVVSHIAGDAGGFYDDGEGKGGREWRAKQGAAAAGAHQGMVRTLSATDATSPSLYGQTGAGIFVAYKNKKADSWRFIMQAQDEKNGHRVIVKTTESLG